MRQILLFVLCMTLVFQDVFCQAKVVEGKVKDGHSDEVVPFASVTFKMAGTGRLSDSSGGFLLAVPSMNDTLEITSVGYQDFRIAVKDIGFQGDTGYLVVRLVPGKFTDHVVIKAKGNRGLWVWKRIVWQKPMKDRYRFQNFSYELYNKLELDLKNINKQKLSKKQITAPLRLCVGEY